MESADYFEDFCVVSYSSQMEFKELKNLPHALDFSFKKAKAPLSL